MHCTSCGQPNHDDAKFCGACGSAIVAPPHHDGDATETRIVAQASPPTATSEQPLSKRPSNGPPVRLLAVIVLVALAGVAAVLLVVTLTGGGGGALPSAEALNEPAADLSPSDDGTATITVDVDFDGSVDNIALYGNGALVDEAGNLGGSLVWVDAPEGEHSLVLRAQLGDDVLIGTETVVQVGPRETAVDEELTTSTTASSDEASTSTSSAPSSSVAPTTAATTSTTAPPIGPYVAVLASLPKSTVDLDAAEASGQSLSIEFGLEFHRIIDSDEYASLRGGFWVVVTSQNFETLADAARHCFDLGAVDSSTCFGRPVTQNPDDLTVVGPPAP